MRGHIVRSGASGGTHDWSRGLAVLRPDCPGGLGWFVVAPCKARRRARPPDSPAGGGAALANGREHIMASWAGRQLLKSAH